MDDPLLWEYQFPVVAAYFKGTAANPFEAACEFLGESSIRLELNAKSLASVLATGNGFLGRVAERAFRRAKAILARHGMEVYSVGGDNSAKRVDLQLLRFDSGFVIAREFSAQRVDTIEVG